MDVDHTRGTPLVCEAVACLMSEWGVELRDLATLLAVDEAGLADLRAGREPSGMDGGAALRLGVLVGALPGLVERHGRDRICEMLAGRGRAGHLAMLIFQAATVAELVDVLDAIDAVLAVAAAGDPLASPL